MAVGHRLHRVGRGIDALAEQALEIGADRLHFRLNRGHLILAERPCLCLGGCDSILAPKFLGLALPAVARFGSDAGVIVVVVHVLVLFQ